jgi:ribosome-associated protein
MSLTPKTKEDHKSPNHPDQSRDTHELLSTITDALLEKKGRSIVQLDVRDLTTLTDYFIICHGTSDTQIGALAKHVLEEARTKRGEKAWKQEGIDARRWIILDYVDVVVHIFNEEKRDFYGFEKMWNDAVRTEISDLPSESSDSTH